MVESAHDVSLGGIIIALSKMAIKGKKGFKLNKIKTLINKFEYYFGEDQARYIVEVKSDNLKQFKKILDNNSIHYDELGIVTKNEIIIDKEPILHIDELIESNTNWLVNYMENKMAMDLKEIEKLIKEAMPDAKIEIQDLAGDGNHYSATVTSSEFSGKTKIEQHKMVYNSLKGKMGNELHALAIKTKES